MSVEKEDSDTSDASKVGWEGLEQPVCSVQCTSSPTIEREKSDDSSKCIEVTCGVQNVQCTSPTMGRKKGNDSSKRVEMTCRVQMNIKDTAYVGCVVPTQAGGGQSSTSGLAARQTSEKPRDKGREEHEGNGGQRSEAKNRRKVGAVCGSADNVASSTESDNTVYCGVGADCEVSSECNCSVPATAHDTGCDCSMADPADDGDSSGVNSQVFRETRTGVVLAVSLAGSNCTKSLDRDEDCRDKYLDESDTDIAHSGGHSGGILVENGDSTNTFADENGSDSDMAHAEDANVGLAEGQHLVPGPHRRRHLARQQRRQNISNPAPPPRRLSLPPSVLAQWHAVGRQWGVESDDDIAHILMRNYEDVMAGRPPRPPPRPRCEECGEVLVPQPCGVCGPHQHSARLSHDPGHGRSSGGKGGSCGRCRD